MSKTYRVALCFQTPVPHWSRIMSGIIEYARSVGGWEFAYNPEGSVVTLDAIQDWKGDGVIATITNPEEAILAQRLQIPVVNISAAGLTKQFPTVTGNDEAAGRLAAEHLLARGFRNFGLYGLTDTHYAKKRQHGFLAALKEAGFDASMCLASTRSAGQPWQWDREQLSSWLSGLKAPVGIFAVHDYRARMVLEMCHKAGLHVPRDVAVLGVNDDQITCEHCNPPLTSVPHDGRRIGMEAAGILASLMAGQTMPIPHLRIAPLPVSQRASTDTLAVSDPSLRQVLELIHSTNSASISIEQLADSAKISRRWLEQLFQKNLGCTPYDYIHKMRIALARELLTRTPRLKLNEIAKRSGFSSARRFSLVFQRFTGKMPSAYRAAPHEHIEDSSAKAPAAPSPMPS